MNRQYYRGDALSSKLLCCILRTDVQLLLEVHRFLRDTLLDSRPEIKEKYYYALLDVTVRGSCSCYGHASKCLPVNGGQKIDGNMVHGKCECTHNTKGLNCEVCEDFFQDQPWMPARPNQSNECKVCRCNDHATKCHFDAALYQINNGTSGGVCDDCQHNTMGVNCQECIDFFYMDPFADIRDPEICRPCDCDSHGSLRNGMCEKTTDESSGTVAGRCKCKAFVEGPRCDRCRENFWNLQEDNDDGCQPCNCNPDGILSSGGGCDMETGACNCKRFVQYPRCDQCFPEYYGLDADLKDGCKPCDCDVGGSLSSVCNNVTGKCSCRPHITGQKCTRVEPGYFFPHLDYYLFEAENAKVIGEAQVLVIKPYRRHNVNYWTGPGYMVVKEGDSLEFTVSGLPFDTYYNIIIRYDPRMPDVFEDIRVDVLRPTDIDPQSACVEYNINHDKSNISMIPGSRWINVDAPVCLERDTTYTIKIDFNNYGKGSTDRDTVIRIDSIVLVPNTDYIPIYSTPGNPTYQKQAFRHAGCDIVQLPSLQNTLSELCRDSIFSISSVLHNGAIGCGLEFKPDAVLAEPAQLCRLVRHHRQWSFGGGSFDCRRWLAAVRLPLPRVLSNTPYT
ncbi:hypothetical protein RRG08_062266 [Elysia crispata]|uniref:Laminin subunit beta-1 n=1 Tax=Elysia crispata TaxID=231223 RepID=A0AAE0YHU1_9GAST|nr:hypothetical protein RRG08_062266 [Elysia crispata]